MQQTSAIGNRKFGFTLLELIVVILIIGLISTVAMQTINWQSKEQLAKKVAERFIYVYEYAIDRTVLEQVPYKLTFKKEGYYFSKYNPFNNSWRDVVSDKYLKEYIYPKNLQLNLANLKKNSQIIIKDSHAQEEFVINVIMDNKIYWQVINNYDGRLQLRQIGS